MKHNRMVAIARKLLVFRVDDQWAKIKMVVSNLFNMRILSVYKQMQAIGVNHQL